uniref:Vinculin n=1 Tax=Meloidogyne hapla TaxID=6305 RepID=A0A1I8BIC7_MELHA
MPVFHTKVIESILEPVAQQLHLALSLAHQHCLPSSSSSFQHHQNGFGEDFASTSSGTRLLKSSGTPQRFAPYWSDLNGGEGSSLSQSSSRYSIPRTMSPSTDCAVCQMLLPKGGPVRCFLLVSRLVILHEEAEDGSAMPDLTKPVSAVSRAVDNLIKVGYETCNSSDDKILKQEMPPALQRVEVSSRLLEEACYLLKSDPFSSAARKKLIDGARGILQGTSQLLLCFDESEVRKIVRICRKVLDYLAVAEVIESMDDLNQFVKDITPWLTRMAKDVDSRSAELTHQVHREILIRCTDSVKILSPILICAMKIYIQISEESQKGLGEAASNRNYLGQRMTDEVNEIIRVLQLTAYDEDEWDQDNVTVMRKALSAAQSLLSAACEWLSDPNGRPGAVGEKAIRRICEYAEKIAARSLPEDQFTIRQLVKEITNLTDSICELRHQGRDNQSYAQSCAQKLRDLVGTKESQGMLPHAVFGAQRTDFQHPAHTSGGKLEQAQRWLDNPGINDGGVGLQAIRSLIDEARRLANKLPPIDRDRLLNVCADLDKMSNQLSDLERRGLGNTPEANNLRQQLREKLRELSDLMKRVLTDKVVEDFADITTPLKAFVEAVYAPMDQPYREENFESKSSNLKDCSGRMANTGLLVAKCGPCKNKKTVEGLIDASNKVNQMTPQIISAGKIRLHNSTENADRHFENLRKEYADALNRLRAYVDDAIDTGEFVRASEGAMRRYTNKCEDAISTNAPQKMVDNTSQIARLGNRVLMSAKNEADNSEDPQFVRKVNDAASNLHSAIPPMVNQAKQVAINPRDQASASRWRDTNDHLLDSVRGVGDAITGLPSRRATPQQHVPPQRFENNVHAPPPSHTPLNSTYHQQQQQQKPPPQWPSEHNVYESPMRAPGEPIVHNRLIVREELPAPPRPPPPVEISPAPRPPPPPELDEEEETRAFWERYHLPAAQYQPILSAAHNLHQELRQWSSHENDIVAAAKRMAILMARLSQLVRGEGGTKKDLIDCAKAIADSSEEVTRLAVQLARQCTDIKMRTTLLQIAERIPTIATQLKILATVKATMLGSQRTEEDEEAMEQLVLNAQNLMQSVKDTVRAAEAASIKIRTNS